MTPEQERNNARAGLAIVCIILAGLIFGGIWVALGMAACAMLGAYAVDQYDGDMPLRWWEKADKQ